MPTALLSGLYLQNKQAELASNIGNTDISPCYVCFEKIIYFVAGLLPVLQKQAVLA